MIDEEESKFYSRYNTIHFCSLNMNSSTSNQYFEVNRNNAEKEDLLLLPEFESNEISEIKNSDSLQLILKGGEIDKDNICKIREKKFGTIKSSIPLFDYEKYENYRKEKIVVAFDVNIRCGGLNEDIIVGFSKTFSPVPSNYEVDIPGKNQISLGYEAKTGELIFGNKKIAQLPAYGSRDKITIWISTKGNVRLFFKQKDLFIFE